MKIFRLGEEKILSENSNQPMLLIALDYHFPKKIMQHHIRSLNFSDRYFVIQKVEKLRGAFNKFPDFLYRNLKLF